MGRQRHAGCASGAFGGAPYGATKHVRGLPKWGGGAMRAVPLWSSLWGHEVCAGCAKMRRRRHAGCATGAFDGAPYGATKRVRGLPKWGGGAMWA
eukprot:7328751-Pyramimonas_sp.AAC.1